MNVAEFIEAFRSDLADQAKPGQLWSDEDIVRYLNAAVQEANERALLTEDSTTAAVCTIATQVGVGLYPLHPSVFRIKFAYLDGRPIHETSAEEMNCSGITDWRTRSGTARDFIFVQASGVNPAAIQLTRLPTVVGSIALTVYRGALTKLNADLDTAKPEIPERFHEQLKDWVYRCAYLKQDVEAMDRTKAAEFESLFERSFGAKPDANVQRKQRDKRPPIVRCSW